MDKPYNDLPVFDFHTHCFPDAIAERSVGFLADKAGIPAYHAGRAEDLLAYQREMGTCGHLVLPIATKPSQARSILDFAARLDRKEGVRALGSVHPFDPEFEKWLDYAVDLGLAGIKLHPEYQDFFVDDERVFPLYDALFRRGLLLVFHAGEDLGFTPPFHGTPERLAVVCERYPQGRIVAAHLGGYNLWDEAEKHLAGRENLWLDCSFAAGVLPDERFAAIARKHGLRRVLFGTDSPWKPIPETLAAVYRAGFSREEMRGVLCDNALELLGF